MTLFHGENELEKLGDHDLAKILGVVHETFQSRHPNMKDVPLPETKVALPSLEAVIKGQVDRFIQLGFHKELNPNLNEKSAEAEYRRDFTIPEGATFPESYKGRFDIIMVSEPRISLSVKHAKGGVKEWINTSEIENLTNVPSGPYLSFTHDGQKYLGLSVKQAIARFEADEVGQPQTEVTDLYLLRPEFFTNRGRDAAGSRLGGLVPSLDTLDGYPRVDAHLPVNRDDYWGAGSRGKEIIVLGS